MAKTRSDNPDEQSNGQTMPPDFLENVEVVVAPDDGPVTLVDSDGTTAEITQDADGSAIVDFSPEVEKESDKFGDNLAEHIPEGELRSIAQMLVDAIEDDERDRSEWLQQRSEGMDLLALKVEKPGGGNVGTSSTAVPGQSTVRDPILLEAVLRFQANAYGELCPSGGPAKAINFGEASSENDKLAEDLEKDFNYFLTTTATEWAPDTRRMLFWTGFASGMYKKVYKCPLRRRPVSESVDGSDLIVPSNCTDLRNAGRITHQIQMRQSVMRRMQIIGVYRDVPLTQPTPQPNTLQEKVASIAGMALNNVRDEDDPYTVYECYCELDLPGFEHKQDGKETGLPLPYRVTIDKDSMTILEIRRNWREDDEDQKAKIPFVLFAYATGVGIYGSGLLHILGNTTMALTAMLREGIDAGMFANFPGALIAAGATRQKTNEIRVAPGALAPIDLQGGMKIGDAIMPLPYKDITPGLFQLMGMVRDVGNRVGGSAEIPVGEGNQNAPVGTTLAMIDQATKIEGGVHKALHAAQAEELQLLKELFIDDPEALWRGNRRPAMGADYQARLARFKKALEDCEIVPASDPNVPSHMHRLAKAQALKQLTMGNPAYDQVAVDRRVAAMLKIDDFDALLAPPQPLQLPPPNPAIMAKLQIDKQNADTNQLKVVLAAQHNEKALASKENLETLKIASQHAKADGSPAQPEGPDPIQVETLALKRRQLDQQDQKMAFDAHNAHADREAKLSTEALKLSSALPVHPLSDQIVDEQLQQMAPLIKPANGGMPSGGMANGGPVPGPLEMEIISPESVDDDRGRTVRLALAIADALRERRAGKYIQ